jgi:predicted porin
MKRPRPERAAYNDRSLGGIKVKKTWIAAAVAAAAGSAHAQSNVTIYGTLDAAVADISHYAGTLGVSNFKTTTTGSTTTYSAKTSTTNPPDSGTVFVSSLLATSNFGFKGVEDLGDGLSAIFDLQGKIVPGDGTGANSTPSGGAASAGGLFDRNAYVGLSGAFGTLRAGRYYTTAYTYSLFADAITLGANSSYNVVAKANGVSQDYWNNNQLRYDSPSLGGVVVSANWAPGGVAGSSSALTSEGFGLKYTGYGLQLAAAYQQDKSGLNPAPAAGTPNQGKFDWSDLAAAYTFGDATVSALYIKSKVTTLANGTTSTFYWPGYVPTYLYPNGAITATGAVAAAGNPFRSTNVFGFGGSYRFTPAWSLAGQFYDIKWKNDSIAPAAQTGQTSRLYTLVLGYAFSKRTSAYLDFVDAQNKDLVLGTANGSNLQGTLPGANGSALGQRLLGIGLKTTF